LPVEVQVPVNTIPGYTLPNSSRRLYVVAVADVLGFDPQSGTEVTIRPQPNHDLAGIQIRARDIGNKAASRTRSKMITDAMLPLLFGGLGMVFLVAAVYWGINPPKAWGDPRVEGDTEFGLIAFGLGLGGFMAGSGAFIWFQQWPRTLSGIQVSVEGEVQTRERPLHVNVENSSGKALNIGLEGIETYEIDSGPSTNPSRRIRGDAANVFHADWRKLPQGTHSFEFELAPDTPPTYPGQLISVDYQVRVSSRSGKSRLKGAEHRTPVLVVA
jgi:hypothetical protein